MTPLVYRDTSALQKRHAHGMHAKNLMVLHETVSHDLVGWGDVMSIEKYLADRDYGIHSVNDFEGHIGYAYGLGRAVFWQAGGVNTQSIGIEQVSWIPAMLQAKQITVAHARDLWLHRTKQLHATAQTIAAISKAHHIPIRYVEGDGNHTGVTTHYSVSKYKASSEGHTDCWPVNDGGYYPTSVVIDLARTYFQKGVTILPPGV